MPYRQKLSFASEASLSTGEPDWKKWIVGLLALLTLLNTTDVALSGLAMTLSISTVLNVGLIALNIAVAISYVLIMAVDTVCVPRHRLRNLVKCGLTAGACYGMAMAAFATLAAVTPGANLLVVVLFVANAVAIGVIVMNAACDLFVPRIETLFNTWRYARRGKRRNPTKLSDHEIKDLGEGNSMFLTRCKGRVSPQTFTDKGFRKRMLTKRDDGGNETVEEESDDDFLLGMRNRFVLFFKAERESLTTKYVGSALAEDDKIKTYASAQQTLMTKDSFWPTTSPYELYMKKLGSRVDKLTMDLTQLYQLNALLHEYKQSDEGSKHKSAFVVLAKIAGAEPDQYGSGLVVIDRLLDACRYLKDKDEVQDQDYIDALNYYVAFDKDLDALDNQIDALVEIASDLLAMRMHRKCFKLHDACGMEVDEIKAALTNKMNHVFDNDVPDDMSELIKSLLDDFKTELNKRIRSCPSVDHRCCVTSPLA